MNKVGKMKTTYQRRKGKESSSFGTNGRINHDSSKFYDSKLYKELANNKKVNKQTNLFPTNLLNTTILGSAENMSMIPDNSLHLMITSPPLKFYPNPTPLMYLHLL